jgi:hypothetical protein
VGDTPILNSGFLDESKKYYLFAEGVSGSSFNWEEPHHVTISSLEPHNPMDRSTTHYPALFTKGAGR